MRPLAFRMILALGTAAVAAPLHAQTSAEENAALLSYARFGLSLFEMADTATAVPGAITLNPNDTDADAVARDFVGLAKGYKARMAAGAAEGRFVQDAGAAVIDVATVVGTASGVGALPTLFARSGAAWANEQIAGYVQRSGEAKAQALLSTQLGDWTAAKDQQFRTLMSQGRRAEAAELFATSTQLMTGLRNDLADDPKGQQIAQDALVDTLARTTYAALQQGAQTAGAVTELRAEFAGFNRGLSDLAQKTEKRLDGLTTELESLGVQMSAAQADIRNLYAGQTATANQLAVVQDVLFSQAPTSQRIAMLEGGLMPNLQGSERDRTLAALRVEQRKERVMATASKVAAGVRDVASIMNSFGVDDPRLGQAVQVASVTEAALSSALSGNYLGAVAAVSSMFGRRGPDPDAARFKAIMQQLARIDAKLNRVIDLQMETLRQVDALSRQLAAFEERTNERLDRVEFELGGLSRNVRRLLWQDYGTCQTAWTNRNSEFDAESAFLTDELRFRDIGAALRYSDRSATSATACYHQLNNLFSTVRADKLFGNLLSVTSAVGRDASVFAVAEDEEGRYWSRSALQNYLEFYTRTSSLVIQRWPHADAARLPGIFATLSAPSASVVELDRRLTMLDKADAANTPYLACRPDRSLLGRRLRFFLCDGETNEAAEAVARTRTEAFLADPILAEPARPDRQPSQLEYLGQWVAVVARHADFLRPTNFPIATLEELRTLPGDPKGRSLISNYLSVLDIAIAQQALTYGDVTARMVYDLAWDAKANRPKAAPAAAPATAEAVAIRLLANTNNPWLRRNVLMLALDRAVRTSDDPAAERAGAWLPYAQLMAMLDAHDWGKNDAEDALMLANARDFLGGLFVLPADATVTTELLGTEDRVRRFNLVWGADKFELPTVPAFRDRAIQYPPVVGDLIALRKTYTEKLIDYELLANLPPADRARIGAVLWQSLATH